TSANARSFRTRRSESPQIHRCTGRIMRSTRAPFFRIDRSDDIRNHISISSTALTLPAQPVHDARSEWTPSRVIAEIAVAIVSVVFLFVAIAANQQWLDRHFLPSFFIPRHWYVAIETSVRVMLGIAGVLLALFVRPRVGRFVSRAPRLALQISI